MKHRALRTSLGSNGFTLIELMVTIAIVAILSSIAVPMYSDYVRRGSLPEAFTNLSDYRVKMEQYYQDNRNYGAAACADVAAGPTWANFLPANRKYFTYSCALPVTVPVGQAYTITAAANNSEPSKGHTYTVNHSGTQTTSNFKGSAVTKSCWMSKGDEC